MSQSSNGNPGTALEVKVTWSAPEITFATMVALINDSCVFAPSAPPPGINPFEAVLAFSVDSSVSGTGAILGGTHNAHPLLLQNGNYYVATVVGPPSVQGQYQTIFGLLGQNSFNFINLTNGVINTNLHPDFSSSGGTIKLGSLIFFVHINAMPVGGAFDVLEDNLSYVIGNISFLVTPAAQELANLIRIISGMGLAPKGIATSLSAKVNDAFVMLDENIGSSFPCLDMVDLISEAQAQSGKLLTVAQANSIIAAAEQVESQLGCNFF